MTSTLATFRTVDGHDLTIRIPCSRERAAREFMNGTCEAVVSETDSRTVVIPKRNIAMARFEDGE